MSTKTIEKIRKNAAIAVFFQTFENGYLNEKQNVFAEVDNRKVINIYVDDASDEEVSEFLFALEMHLNSLNLNLSDDVFTPTLVKEKLVEAFSFDTIVTDFDVMYEGEAVRNEVEVEVEEKQAEQPYAVEGQMGLDDFMSDFEDAVEQTEEEKEEEEEEEEEKEDKTQVESEEEIPEVQEIEEPEQKNEEKQYETETMVETKEDPAIEETKEIIHKIAKTVSDQPKRTPKYFYKDEDVKEYLSAFDLPKSMVNWVIEKRKENRERVSTYPQMIINEVNETLNFVGSSSVIRKCISAMMLNEPLNLEGPAGVGKTTVLGTLSTLLNYPLFTVNGSSESNITTLVGRLDIKEKGLISVNDGQMTKAAIYGGILYIDEINMIHPSVLSLINGFTDHRRAFQNDVRGETIFLHPDTQFVSAMNKGYSGTKKMNEATGDRSGYIKLEYMGKTELKTMIKQIVGNIDLKHFDELSLIDLEKISKVYGHLIEAVKEEHVPDLSASTRGIIRLAKFVPILGFQEALDFAILDRFDEEEIDAILGVLSQNGLLDEIGYEMPFR